MFCCAGAATGGWRSSLSVLHGKTRSTKLFFPGNFRFSYAYEHHQSISTSHHLKLQVVVGNINLLDSWGATVQTTPTFTNPKSKSTLLQLEPQNSRSFSTARTPTAMTATKIDGTAIAKSIRDKLHAQIEETQKTNPRFQPSLKIIQGNLPTITLPLRQ